MQIRTYEDSDEAAVISLWQETLFDPAPHNDPQSSLQRKLSLDRDLLLVAAINGLVVGTVMGGYDGHRGWIYSVAVDQTVRRQGVGTALIRRLEAILKERGCLKLNLQVRSRNSGVIPFYESLGFRIEEIVSLGKRLYS
jgi:ribosomal protein S18 acetylase RimI-like enzyme